MISELSRLSYFKRDCVIYAYKRGGRERIIKLEKDNKNNRERERVKEMSLRKGDNKKTG